MAFPARCGLPYEDAMEPCKSNQFICPVLCADGKICGQLLIKHPGVFTRLRRYFGGKTPFRSYRYLINRGKKYKYKYYKHTRTDSSSFRHCLLSIETEDNSIPRQEFLSWMADISAPHIQTIRKIINHQSYESADQLILHFLWKYLNKNHPNILLDFVILPLCPENLAFTHLYDNQNDLDLRARPWGKFKKRLPRAKAVPMKNFEQDNDFVWGHFKKFVLAHDQNLFQLKELSEGITKSLSLHHSSRR
jgi:hypothetical protein